MEITRAQARQAIENLSQGLPPSTQITDLISVGLERDLAVFTDEYFGAEGLLRETDQGTFKLVEGYYGGGKTHYLRAIERLAHRHGFASAFIELSKDSCPLSRFDLIYQRIAERLVVPLPSGSVSTDGIAGLIRLWVTPPTNSEIDPSEYAQQQLKQLGDLPMPSLRIAIDNAAHAAASDDQTTFDEIMVYLHSGKIAPVLRKRGILEAIDVRSGALAIRCLAIWLRQISYPGLLLVMDEGDRSLSIASAKERTTASNNLVQLINETLKGTDWPGVMFLYSIPSWAEFHNNLSANNMALEQRVQGTGFPNFPPAPRIVLDERYPADSDKQKFCLDVAKRLSEIFAIAYPAKHPELTDSESLAQRVASAVVDETLEVNFRRLFVKTYLQILYTWQTTPKITDYEIKKIITNSI